MLGKYEPIRLYIYGLIGPLSLAIIGFGLYDSNKVLWIAGILTAVLTVPAAEKARQKVIPVEKSVLTGNLVNDVRLQLEQGVSMLQQQVASSLPGILLPTVTHSVDQAIIASQIPTESVASGKVDSMPTHAAVEENPYA